VNWLTISKPPSLTVPVHILYAVIHFAAGIGKNAQLEDFCQHASSMLGRVAHLSTQQHQQAGTDVCANLTRNLDPRLPDALQQGHHEIRPAKRQQDADRPHTQQKLKCIINPKIQSLNTQQK
jgi:hypothetical protein